MSDAASLSLIGSPTIYTDIAPEAALNVTSPVDGEFTVAAPVVAATPEPEPAKAPQDVTDTIPGLAPEDRVFLTSEGYRVKVKAVLSDETSPIGAHVFMLSGSIVGEDGKALRRSSGSPAVHDLKRTHHQMSDAMSDPVIGLTAARLSCVADTVRAEKHRDLIKGAVTGGAGLATAAGQAARKAAEAESKEA